MITSHKIGISKLNQKVETGMETSHSNIFWRSRCQVNNLIVEYSVCLYISMCRQFKWNHLHVLLNNDYCQAIIQK